MQDQSKFDPAAHGWETYRSEGFIDYVGPFWMRPDASMVE